jgi:hypothetical protein
MVLMSGSLFGNIFFLLHDLHDQSAVTTNLIFSIALDTSAIVFAAMLICVLSLTQIIGNVMETGIETDKRLAALREEWEEKQT